MNKWGLAVFVLFLCMVAFFPYIGSSSLGKPFVLLLLQRNLPGTLSIKKVRLSWFGPQVFERVTLNAKEYTVKCEVISSSLPLWKIEHLGRQIQVQNGSFSSLEYPEGELFDIQATVQNEKVEMKAITPQKGSLSIHGTLPINQSPFNLTATLRNMPTVVLDNLLKCNTWLTKTLGPLCNIEALYTSNAENQNLSMDLTSKNAKSSLRAEIQDHTIHLTAPWISTIVVSDSLRSSLLAKMQSQWITDFQPKNPVTITIYPEDFQCPFSPFSLADLQIEKGSLNLGKVLLQSDPSTRFLMKLLKGKGLTNPILCWFTPMSFALEKGILSLGRVDALLSQSIHLCTWGSINLITDRLHMFLGIPIATLRNILDVSLFSSDYVFKIPITGSLTHPKFDTGPVLGKIATMAASQSLSTGAPGKAFDGLVKKIIQSQDQNDVPPPNRPFPWER